MLNRFPQVAATLKRHSAAATVNGRYVPGDPTETPITIIPLQPAPGKDLQQLPEGDRTYVHKKTWTNTEVLKGDHLEVAGVDYMVALIRDFTTGTTGWGFNGGYHLLVRESQ